MKMHLLSCGRLKMRKSIFIPSAERSETIELPLSSALLRQGQANVLFDTGCHPAVPENPEARWGGLAKLMVPIMQPGEHVLTGLAGLGLEPDDIDVVINSHLHPDHCGCNAFFRKATFICHADELAAASAPNSEASGYLAAEWEQPMPVDTIQTQRDVFGDGRIVLVPLPGHTPGSIGALAQLDRSGADRRVSFKLPDGSDLIYLEQGDKHIVIAPGRKQYAELTPEATGIQLQKMMTPGLLVSYLEKLKGVERVGDETINGRSADKYSYANTTNTSTSAGQVNTEAFVYVDKDTGLPLRSELYSEASGNVQGVKGAKIVAEMRDITTTVDPSLFQVPAGLSKVPAEQVRSQIDAFTNTVAAVIKALLSNMAPSGIRARAPTAPMTAGMPRLWARMAAWAVRVPSSLTSPTTCSRSSCTVSPGESSCATTITCSSGEMVPSSAALRPIRRLIIRNWMALRSASRSRRRAAPDQRFLSSSALNS